MTNEPVKAPGSWAWLIVASWVAMIVSYMFGGVADVIAGIILMYLSGTAIWAVGHWLWFTAQEHWKLHRG